MRSYTRIFHYLTHFKARILLYFVFILFSILFSIVSIGMLMPFLQLIFTGEESSALTSSSNQLLQAVNNSIYQ